MTILDEVRAIADPLIAGGANLNDVNRELGRQLGVMIGGGGSGTWREIPPCKYCGAYGGGGHGGFCPGPGLLPAQTTRPPDEPRGLWPPDTPRPKYVV